MSRKMVFVIGAGASKEIHLPVGSELKNIISNMLDIQYDHWGNNQIKGDHLINKALFEHAKNPDGSGGDVNSLIYEARHISLSLIQAESIDNFIDQHRGNKQIELLAKLAVARSILSAEKNSLLKFNSLKSNDHSKIIDNYNDIEKTWYLSLFKLITENCSADCLEKRFKSISLIIFNYDRCIEYFLYFALQDFYRLTPEKSALLVNTLSVYHPYGDVGDLYWSSKNDRMAYGEEPNSSQLLNLTKRIKTFTEGVDDKSSNIREIRKNISSATDLVFLGFAFHKLNMSLLFPKNKISSNQFVNCFATTYGISRSDENFIKSQLSNHLGNHVIHTSNIECNKFFNKYRRSLSF